MHYQLPSSALFATNSEKRKMSQFIRSLLGPIPTPKRGNAVHTPRGSQNAFIPSNIVS